MTKQVTQYCGHCREKVEFDILYWNIKLDEYKGEEGQRKLGAKDKLQEIADALDGTLHINHELALFCSCPRCKKSSVVCFAVSHNQVVEIDYPQNCEVENHHLKNYVCTFPNHRIANIEEFWPKKIKETFDGIQKMISGDVSAALTLGAIGTALELTTKALGQKTGTLKSKIDKLAEKGIITDGLKEWAHEIRYLRNDGTHDGEGEDEDVQEMFNFLKTFLELTFTLPHKMKERKAISANISEPKND